jgi:hypothetical protein
LTVRGVATAVVGRRPDVSAASLVPHTTMTDGRDARIAKIRSMVSEKHESGEASGGQMMEIWDGVEMKGRWMIFHHS